MIVHVFNSLEDFADIQPDWDRLARQEFKFFPNFSDIYHYARVARPAFRLIVAQNEHGIQAIACFVLTRTRRGFWVGKRKLFDLPVHSAQLQGAAILGDPDAALATAMLDRLLADREVSFVDLGDVAKSTGLYAAARKPRWAWLKNEFEWRAIRRLIVLPASFGEYLAGLRATTRKAAVRDRRIFARLDPVFRVMTRPEDMRRFLVDAASVGDKTYQAGNVFGIDASEARVSMLEGQAASGKLLAFLACVGGRPCAFLWGDLSYDVFYFRYTGFDPEFRKHCAGTAILLNAIEYLIENNICQRFDFGIRDMAYKERFATHAIDCAYVTMGSYRRPTATLAIVLDRLLDAAKPIFLGLVRGLTRPKRIKQIIGR